MIVYAKIFIHNIVYLLHKHLIYIDTTVQKFGVGKNLQSLNKGKILLQFKITFLAENILTCNLFL